jgi:hypothetical protein
MPIWVYPNLNDTLPAAPDGHRNTKWQGGAPYTDSDGIRRRDTSCYEPSTGGVSVKTGDYTLVAADCGKFIVLDSASPHTFRLPNPVPFPEWTAALICRGAGALSVDANGLLLDGVGTSPVPTLTTGQGILVQTDGSNYASFAGKDNGGAPGAGRPYPITFYAPGQYTNSELIVAIPITENVTIPANFSDGTHLPTGKCDGNPAATATWTLKKLHSGVLTTVGTVSWSTSGVPTFATTSGAAQSFVDGDELQVINQAVADASFAGGRIGFRASAT